MSISAGHRAIASAFGWGHRPARRTTATFRAPESPATTSQAPSAAPPAGVESDALVCSPWEGLYLEQARPVTGRGDEATTSQPLDSFLNGLMYGE